MKNECRWVFSSDRGLRKKNIRDRATRFTNNLYEIFVPLEFHYVRKEKEKTPFGV